MTNNLARLVSKPNALKALDALERELDSPRTYAQLRKIIQAAEILKKFNLEVIEVKQKAEWVILVGNRRIGEELAGVDKAPRGAPAAKITPEGKLRKPGLAATGIPGTSRSRLGKLAAIARDQLKHMAEELWHSGKDATIKAVLGERKEEEIRDARKTFEARRDRGARVADLQALIDAGETFPVIAADPAWEFKVYSGKGKQRSAERHYDTDTLDGIKAFGAQYITPLAAPDCALFLWGVWPELPGALDVITSWGFEYKTAGFVWVKTTPTTPDIALDGDGLHWGMGYHTRANTEPCLLATRGSPQRTAKDVHQVVIAPVQEHSVKPAEVYTRIEQLLIGPYLEIFARQPRPGWTTWGHELESDTDAAA